MTPLRNALIGTRFAAHLHHFTTIGSTNTDLLAAAADNAPEGTVYYADEQTAGRGRSNHAWDSAAHLGLYVSTLVRPTLPLRHALWLSLATGLAAQTAVRNLTGLTTDIRWPNDILLDRKKLGGILVESAVDGEQLRYAVIGIGINLNHTAFPADLAPLATSLRIATGSSVPRDALLIALLRALDHELTLLETTPETLLPRFTAASTWVTGKQVHVPEQGGYTGVTVGLDPAGFLQVRAADGTLRTVMTGGVREL